MGSNGQPEWESSQQISELQEYLIKLVGNLDKVVREVKWYAVMEKLHILEFINLILHFFGQ